VIRAACDNRYGRRRPVTIARSLKEPARQCEGLALHTSPKGGLH